MDLTGLGMINAQAGGGPDVRGPAADAHDAWLGAGLM